VIRRAAGALRVVVHAPLDGALNMAVDDVLLEGTAARTPYTLRLYGWRRPTVSLGYGQRWRDGFDRELAARRGVDVVRRRTGGRAVMHASELTYSVSGPVTEGPFIGGVQPTYRVIAGGLVGGLARLGLAASLERSRGKRERAEPGACFASRARHEVLADGRKLIGSAQRRTQHRILQHGSLPLPAPDPVLWRVLGPTGPEAAAGSVGLWELVRPRPASRTLARALADGLGESLDLSVFFASLSRLEWRAAVARAAYYADPGHTFRL
jgi:lipoate-protein ligase A